MEKQEGPDSDPRSANFPGWGAQRSPKASEKGPPQASRNQQDADSWKRRAGGHGRGAGAAALQEEQVCRRAGRRGGAGSRTRAGGAVNEPEVDVVTHAAAHTEHPVRAGDCGFGGGFILR